MAVTNPGSYEAIVEYELITDPSNKHRNTYGFHSTAVPAPGDHVNAALTALAPHMAMSTYHFTRFAVYAWARGAQPYPLGLPIYEATAAVPCDAEIAWGFTAGGILVVNPTAKEVVLRVDREPQGGGRPGHLFYRGLLPIEAIESPSANVWQFTPNGATVFTQATLDALLAASGFTALFGAGLAGQHWEITRYGPKHGGVPTPFEIASLGLIGPDVNRPTRKNKR